MDLFTYLLGKKGQNTHRDLFSYLLGKGAGGSGTYVNFTGTSLNISNTLKARIKNITLKGATSQDGTPTPDTPIPIKVVTGEQNVNIKSKNLYDKNNLQNGYVNSSGVFVADNSWKTTKFISVASSTKYTISNVINRYLICQYTAPNEESFVGTRIDKNTSTTFTTEATTKYIRISPYVINNSYEVIQLEEGPTATSYTPYYNKDYPLSLGTLELAKIGTYQDYIYGTPNNWYKYKYVNSREVTVYNVNTSYSNLVYATISKPNEYLGKANYGNYKVLFEKGQYLYKTGNTWDTTEYINKILPNGNNNLFYFGLPLGTTKEQAEEILNGTKLYYPIEPTPEPITDTTLIEQLNNLYNATSQEGTTYITCSSASDSNEIIVFSGDIKVTSVGNSLNTSLLSSNLQEETNIDDIQEEPTLDDVNETEDIEQNEEPIEEEVS